MQSDLYWRLSLLQFLLYFVHGSWYVSAGTYLMRTLDFSGREIGLSYGSMAIAATVSPFIMGRLADQVWPTDRILAISHLIGGLLLFLLSYLQAFYLFYPVIIAYALVFMPTMALTNSLCFHHIADAQSAFPKVRVWGTVGFILAGFLTSWLNAEAAPIPMRIASIGSLSMGLYCFTLPATPPVVSRSSLKETNLFTSPEIRNLFSQRNFQVLFISLILVAIPGSFYYSFVNPFLVEQGMTNPAGKMALGQVTEIGFMLLLPLLFRPLGIRYILLIGLAAWGIRYLLFAVGASTNTVAWLYLGILLHGVAFNFTVLATQIFLDKNVPNSLRSTVQGLISLLVQGVGALIGTLIAGEIVNYFTLGPHLHNWWAIWLVPTSFGLFAALFFARGFSAKP